MNIRDIHAILLDHYGNVGWWPGDTDDEILVGSILTQNTSWSNVEKSIRKLKEADLLSVNAIASSSPAVLAPLIRSSGYYNQKAERLVGICRAIVKRYGSLAAMREIPINEVSDFLISLNGIGEETRDSIMNYALDLPVFVVDKYTLRIFGRTGISDVNKASQLRDLVYREIGRDTGILKNFHGMLVFLGKDYCRTKPICIDCPVRLRCEYFITLKDGQ